MKFDYAIRVLRLGIKDVRTEFTYDKIAPFYKDKITELRQAIKILKEGEKKW